MRELQFRDAFSLIRIIEYGDLNQKVKTIISRYQGKKGETLATEAGIEIIMDIICGMSNEKAENEIYKLLASVAEKKADDIKSLSLESTYDLFKEIAEKNDVKDFLLKASRLIQN